ncbi:ATP-grasp domain-containing protein [Mixta sp. Marseille-Q2659]|uniref:ATP-grasp domain-containing protein n=1 Tax=Mixta sp. Marseille-Q2659 TaxID=2736607 RepID=UPI0023B9B644|nr:ATP-grasp domain-containing protein [Mixta sp. Marseille-Q2659]
MQQQDYRQVLVEKFVDGIEYSVETLSLRGEHQLIGVTDKRLSPGSLVEQCHIYPAALPEETFARLARYITRLLDEIGHHHGPMHIEVKLQDDDIQLIEINNRPGGDYIWDMVNKVSGVNLVAETLRYAFSGQPDAQTRRRRQRYGAMSYIALFHSIPPQTISQALAAKVGLDRVQCQLDNGQPPKAIGNSFERPGFILIGEQEPAALRSALPLVEQWIDSQTHHEEKRA